MPQSLGRLVIHIIFSTKNRVATLHDSEVRHGLYAYMAGTLREIGCDAITIGGVEDHVHVLCNLSRTITVANVVEELKKSSSRWVKNQGPIYHDFYWQGGYGAFTVSQSKVPDVAQYIERQEEHHRTVSFQDEFRLFCQKHGVAIDERYVWD